VLQTPRRHGEFDRVGRTAPFDQGGDQTRGEGVTCPDAVDDRRDPPVRPLGRGGVQSTPDHVFSLANRSRCVKATSKRGKRLASCSATSA
jgi:hypothetical protein